MNSKIVFTILMLMLLITSALFPAENETGARTLVRSQPDRPVAGSTWTLTLLIDHSEPDEVNILAPHFEDTIFLEQVVKSPHLLNPSSATDTFYPLERWTAMEFRFVLNSPGTVSFDAFTVITPQGRTMTAPFELNVQRPPNTASVRNYKFVWEGAPSEMRTGENAVFSLRCSDTPHASPLPKTGQFLPAVPPGYILESLPLASGEIAAGIALKLRLIPLETKPFTLTRRQFSHDGAIFEVPALRITVKPAEQKPKPQAEHAAPGNNSAAPFPPPVSDEKKKQSFIRGNSRPATTRETAVRRIPDMAGEEIARFREGQPVLLNGKIAHKGWVWVTANDDNGTSGWVPEEMIIFY